MKKNNIKFIDLCSGIGGFHYALDQLSWECVFASEKDSLARKVYEENFKKKSPQIFKSGLFNDDIYKIKTSDIPDFDVLCAGFPCQPFSQIGQKKGFDEKFEKRGNIFFEILRIIDRKQPKAYFLENVRGLVNHDNGKTFKRISTELMELGYSFNYKVLKASDFGLPQHRPRTFMVGFKKEFTNNIFYFPEPKKLRKTMSDIFQGKCNRDIGFTLRLGGMGSGINDRRNWDQYLVDGKVIDLLPEHAKQMQGYGNDFILNETRAKSLKLLGNSVAINVIKELGLKIEDYLTIV